MFFEAVSPGLSPVDLSKLASYKGLASWPDLDLGTAVIGLFELIID